MSTPLQLERDRAYHGLVDLILGGRLQAAEPLSERKLSEALHIGRTPVREALRDLVRDGLLEVRPARGTYLRQLSPHDVREIYEVREGLEGLAARLAARHGPTPELSAYAPRFQSMIDDPHAHGPEATYQLGARFHTEIFRAARNRQLLDLYQPLRLRFRLALSLPRYFDHERVWASVAEHLDILRAIEARDEARAASLITEHLSRGSEVRGRIFAELAGASAEPAPVAAAAAPE